MQREGDMYAIETLYANAWTRDGLGDERANAFDTEEQAEAAIESLRELGEEWAAADYRVVEL